VEDFANEKGHLLFFWFHAWLHLPASFHLQRQPQESLPFQEGSRTFPTQKHPRHPCWNWHNSARLSFFACSFAALLEGAASTLMHIFYGVRAAEKKNKIKTHAAAEACTQHTCFLFDLSEHVFFPGF
jgi:hypothetical protein